jgi:hypothetical protein
MSRPHLSRLPDRSPEAIERIVAQLDPVKNPRYQKRDIDGDGDLETTCNFFARDALSLLGVGIPQMLANDLCEWFGSPSAMADGWMKFDQLPASMRASLGYPTIACCRGASHGHIALLVPPRGAPGAWIAQTGSVNFSHGSLAKGFGTKKPDFYGCY